MSGEILITSYNGNNVADNHLSTTSVIDASQMDHLCTHNYDGTSVAMDLDGLLLMMIKIEAKYEGHVFLDFVVMDDGTKMKKISHAKYRPNGKNNIGGCLPLSIPKPNWYADPTHRAKCVAGAFF